tara:strand:- start:18520 stop:19584 length:1065 start_codon:yes stop_codon:yes gene_type:complete
VKLRASFTINYARSMQFDLDMESPGITAVFGKSGCGKTTLLRAIAGLDRHSVARLEVNQQVWQDDKVFLPTHQRPLAFVFQGANLFSHLSVQGNIEYGWSRIPANKRKLALQEIIALLDLQTLLQRKTVKLSGGEKQRVALARALAVSPELLLMDEPLAALDQERKEELLPYIENLNKELQIPVLYVSHSSDEVARLADQLIFIEDDCIKATGPIEEMLTRTDLSLAHRRSAESLIHAEAGEYDQQFHLNHLHSAIGDFLVPGKQIQTGKQIRLRLAAQDISLTLEVQKDTSILNIFPATVAELFAEDDAQFIVRLEIRNIFVLARITARSVSSLQLEAGKKVYAQIKGIAVLA